MAIGSKKIGYYLMPPFVLIFVIAVIFGMNSEHKKNMKNWTLFNSSDIHGTIVEMSTSKSGTGFTVSTRPERFVFWPKLYGAGDVRDFELFVREGDSLSKEKYADTIYMFSNNQRYAYTFTSPKD
jgi:hypothetical protein